jgi:hypothetical protein
MTVGKGGYANLEIVRESAPACPLSGTPKNPGLLSECYKKAVFQDFKIPV